MKRRALDDEMETLSQDLGSFVGAPKTAGNFRMMAAKARHVAAVYEEMADAADPDLEDLLEEAM